MSENLDPTEAERELRGLAASSALELASTSYLSTDIDVSGDVADFTLDYALDVLGYLEALQSATRTVRKQLEEFIATKLEGVQYYRHRDQIVKVGGSGTWKVKDDAVNDGNLAGYINDDWITTVNLKAQGAVTVTRLEELATERLRQIMKADGAEPTKKAIETISAAIRSQFFEYKRNDSAISTLPPDKAPKKAQALNHGEAVFKPIDLKMVAESEKAAKPKLESAE